MEHETGKILVVDDSLFFVKFYEKVLRDAGHCVFSTRQSREAIPIAESREIDLIILDIVMPIMGGVDILRQLKKNPETAHLPVIVASSLSQNNAQKLISEGAMAYFQKDKLTEELLKKIVGLGLAKRQMEAHRNSVLRTEAEPATLNA